jgi:hypothetical protein
LTSSLTSVSVTQSGTEGPCSQVCQTSTRRATRRLSTRKSAQASVDGTRSSAVRHKCIIFTTSTMRPFTCLLLDDHWVVLDIVLVTLIFCSYLVFSSSNYTGTRASSSPPCRRSGAPPRSPCQEDSSQGLRLPPPHLRTVRKES